MLPTPVLEERRVQAPVLHLAVIHILRGGHEGQVVELSEPVVRLGVEAGLGHSLSDGLAVAQPGDTNHRREDVIHDADEDIGLSQLHTRLGNYRHPGRL